MSAKFKVGDPAIYIIGNKESLEGVAFPQCIVGKVISREPIADYAECVKTWSYTIKPLRGKNIEVKESLLFTFAQLRNIISEQLDEVSAEINLL